MSALSEKLAAAKAATSGKAAASVLSGAGVTDGMANTATIAAVNAAALAEAKLAALVKPVRTSIDQVLFKTSRASFGSATEEGIRFRFENGYLLTDNAKLIACIRKSADLWNITEDKTPPVADKAKAE